MENLKKSKIVQDGKKLLISSISRLNPELATRILFYFSQGYPLDLKNPKTLNEKLQYLKLHDYYKNDLVTQVVDKYRVREYIKSLGLGYTLTNLVGKEVYDNVDDIHMKDMPKSFVLKCNHDSGSVVICKNKDDFDWGKEKRKLRKSLKKDYWTDNCEVQYKFVPKRIIAEEYIQSDQGLIDYKFFCFNGKPLFLYCTFPHEEEQYQMRFYDLNWKPLSFRRTDTQDLKREISKPEQLEEMIEISKKLSGDFPFARIDLYNVGEKIYFSEITLLPTGGLGKYDDKSIDRKLGDLLEI